MALVGLPGAGKSTQARRLRDALDLRIVSPGAISRSRALSGPDAQMHATALAEGRLLPDEMITAMVADELHDAQAGVVFDGYPRTLGQALLCRSLPVRLCCVVVLDVPATIAEARLQERARSDDAPEVLGRRIRAHESVVAELVEYFAAQGVLLRVDGTSPPATVTSTICSGLNGSR